MESQVKFVCNFCAPSAAEQMTDMEQLEHIRMEHLDCYKPYRCVQCHPNYAVEPKFRQHTIMEHNSHLTTADSTHSSQFLNVLGDVMMQCSFYNASGNKQAATKLINTVKQCKVNRRIKEEIDTSTVPFEISFDTSKTVHRRGTLRKLLACEFCPRLFSSLSSLRSHQDEGHCSVAGIKFSSEISPKPEPPESNQPETHCEHCPMTFKKMSEWRLHQDSRHKTVSNGPYVCSVCDNRFYNYSNYQRCHPDSRKISKGLSCQFCSLKFTNVHQVKTHQADEHTDRQQSVPFEDQPTREPVTPCQHCPMTFEQIGDWRVHQDRKHNTVSNGQYNCSVCNRRYYNYSGYVRCHPDSQKVAQGLLCQFCSLKLKNVHELQKHHVDKHQQNRNMSINKSRSYRCLRCKGPFNGSINYHLATFHIKKGVVGCSECSHTNYWNIAHVRRHIDLKHDGYGRIIDQRQSIAGQIQELRKEIIRCTSGNPMPRKTLSKRSKRSVTNYYTRKSQKWARCSQCDITMSTDSVRGHLAAKHIGKRCIKCEGCKFSSNWQVTTMKMHLKKRHAGGNVGYVDKRHEIEDEIKELTKQYITFHRKY